MKRTDLTQQLSNQDRLPRDVYRIRVLTAVFGMSSKGNPMITVTWEILSDKDGSDVVQIGDRKFNIAGKQITQWFPTAVIGDLVKTEAAQGRVFDLYEKCGVPQDEIDENNPDVSILQNKVVEAILYSQENKKYKEPTAEQRAQGAKVGDVIMVDGKPLVIYQPAVDMIIGPASQGAGLPY